ncbi:tektin-4 [Cololabis saira]|uniref:tektin-4 n=1 Tax=Cololabis saira TaxID=129043 RepID=UPI002AD555BC|nr:tektin-4 [Cololabis saira]
MSSEITGSRRHDASRAVAGEAQQDYAPVETDVPQPSWGAAPAGYSAKYTPGQWFSNHHAVLERAGARHHEAQRIQTQSRVLSRDTEAACRDAQSAGTRLLGERLRDIHLLRSELQRHVAQLQADLEALLALRTRLERALDATEIPYAISTDNLSCRAGRLGPDLVRDAVEEQLLKEVDLIRNIQALLKRTITQVFSQIKMTRETKEKLELDWSDKWQAYGFDDQSGRFSNLSPDTQQHPGSATMQEHMCNPSSWVKFTQNNLSEAVQEEQATNSLRVLVEQMLQDTTQDLRVQCSNVDQAFAQRCVELSEAKIQLEMALAQILEQIGAQERNIVALEQAIHNKDTPMRVAQSRLYIRSLRPNMELCRDQPQLSLEGELRQLNGTLESLNLKLSEARNSLSYLEESRMELEKDINCKTHSLFIDREKCMTHRRRYPTMSSLSGY